MPFPYERYETLAEPLTVYYPTGEETLARWVLQNIERGSRLLADLLNLAAPEMEIILVAPADWEATPHTEPEELAHPHPYWTDATMPPSLVVPLEIDALFGDVTQEKLAYLLFHELGVAFLEADSRPYPGEAPLWADEWQPKFAALWLVQQVLGHTGIVNADMRVRYGDLFEPEADGKTPVTVRGFDWYEDTSANDYLAYALLLEQLAADMLTQFDAGALPRFLARYRTDRDVLLSDEVTKMLGNALGPGGIEWLENLDYF
ncbi:MAG TPA: hypothetical protein VNE61_03500 [Ktedonobacteraceae bacterium]|nr:hypothetical protein [Ktedonobacteraceae bacterium]